MNAVQGDSEMTLDEPEEKLSTRISNDNKMKDIELDILPIWVL